MATYGRDYYGRAKYGSRPHLELMVDPFEARVIGFDSVALSWNEPGGDWGGFRLLRNHNGFPITEDDGEILLDVPYEYSGATGAEYLDTHLVGGWHYYAIFLWDNGAQVWERAAAVDALVPFDYKSSDQFWDSLPEYYKQIRDDGAGYDQTRYRVNPAIYLNNEEVVPNLVLAKFLTLFGWGFDILRTQADQVVSGYDIHEVHVNRLALLAAQFGAQVESAAPSNSNRSMIRNLGWLYRKRGTLEGIRELVSLMTGWEVDVTLGPNIMLSEDQADAKSPRVARWDPSEEYRVGEKVKRGKFLFRAIKKNTGNKQGPPETRTDNEWWETYQEPYEDITTIRDETGDISTWQVEGPDGFVPGRTHVGVGIQDPEDGTVYYQNSLAIRNNTNAPGDFIVRSVPRPKEALGSWGQRMVMTDGIPVPRATETWTAGTRYRAGDLVLFEGALYEAVTSTEADPTTTAWKRLGHDARPRLALSVYAHGPFHGTVNTGGRRVHAVVTEFDEHGEFINEVVCNPASFSNVFYDPFNVFGALTAGRQAAVGGYWSANGVGTWGVNRDDEGGYAYPPSTGRSYQLAPAMVANGSVALTYKAVPTHRFGIVFRWSSSSNFWIATQSRVSKVVSGAAPANPASGALTYDPFVAGDRMEVALDGDTISVFKNGSLVGTATDSFNSSADRHGVVREA